jgi:hypothetical protein
MIKIIIPQSCSGLSLLSTKLIQFGDSISTQYLINDWYLLILFGTELIKNR